MAEALREEVDLQAEAAVAVAAALREEALAQAEWVVAAAAVDRVACSDPQARAESTR